MGEEEGFVYTLETESGGFEVNADKRVRVVAWGVGQAGQPGSIRANRVEFEIAIAVGGEEDDIPLGRPLGEIVVVAPIRERDDLAIRERQNHQLLAALVDDSFAVPATNPENRC